MSGGPLTPLAGARPGLLVLFPPGSGPASEELGYTYDATSAKVSRGRRPTCSALVATAVVLSILPPRFRLPSPVCSSEETCPGAPAGLLRAMRSPITIPSAFQGTSRVAQAPRVGRPRPTCFVASPMAFIRRLPFCRVPSSEVLVGVSFRLMWCKP